MGDVDFFEIGLLIVVFGVGVGGFLWAAYKED